MEQSTLLDEVTLVHQILNYANEYGLQAEVITSAFKHMQDHPGCSIDNALYAGMASWDI
jgi:hypothetical protein